VGHGLWMVRLTKAAAEQVKRLRGEAAPGGKVLRLFVADGGCSGRSFGMAFEDAREGDRLCESGGVRVGGAGGSEEVFAGAEVDFEGGLDGRGFQVRSPSARHTCGCGKSFR